MSHLFTDAQRAAYVRPSCPQCGSNARVSVEWERVDFATGESYWVVTAHDCACRLEAADAVSEAEIATMEAVGVEFPRPLWEQGG